MKPLFITATGTEIGKTYVTAALTVALASKGKSVRVLKPVISGWAEGPAKETDTGRLLAAQGLDLNDAHIEACSPWRFGDPLSPDMAAKREGREIDFEALVAFCRDAGKGPEDILLVEGIGGVMVPLDSTHTVLDWMAAWGAPALIVAGSYLGTLSHTLTTVAAMRGRGVAIAGVVVSQSENSPVALGETVETLARHLSGVTIAAIERNAGPDAVYAALSEMTGF